MVSKTRMCGHSVYFWNTIAVGRRLGASVTMLASELLTNGIDQLRVIRNAVDYWMEEHEYESVTQLRGSMSQRSVAFPAAYERAQYMKVVARPEWSR